MTTKKKNNHFFLRSIPKVANKYLNGQLENPHVIGLLIYFAVISLLELTAYASRNNVALVLGSRIWLIGGMVCVVTLLYYFATAIRLDIKQRKILPLIGIACVIIYLFHLIGNMNQSDISPDAAQQAAAGLSSFLSPVLNYTGKAFLGYPNRQYVIVAIPALLFGRSIETLQLGFAIPFVLGIMMMYSGLRVWTYQKGINGNYAIIPVFAIFTFRYVTEYYINFEQAILPISLTMALIGLFLKLLYSPSVLNIISITWIGCLCSNSYTPVLATLGLLILFLALFAIIMITYPKKLPFLTNNKSQTALILVTADLTMVIFYIATLFGDRADRVTMLRADVDYLTYSLASIYNFLTDKNAIFMGFMGIIIIIYLLLALTFCLKIYDFLIALWALGVFVATNLMVGYTAYSAAWVMQRALIVIPVLVTGISLSLFELLHRYKITIRKTTIAIIMVAFAVIGRYNFSQMNQSFTYFNYIQPMKYMLEDLQKTTKENKITPTDTFNYVLYTDSIAMQNPADYFKFLYPNAKVYIGDYGSFPEEADLSLPTIIYGDRDISGIVPSGVIKEVRYNDKRYDLKGAWFKSVVNN